MKLRRGLAILALLAAVVLPVAAAPIVMTGNVTTGMIGDLSAATQVAGTTFGFVGDAHLTATGVIDDFVTGTLMVGRAFNTIESWTVDQATIDVDVLKFFKFDPKTATLVLRAGLTSSADNGYLSQTAQGSENVSDAGTATGWLFQATSKVVDLVTIKAAVLGATANAASLGDWIIGAYLNPNLGFGTLNFEVFYDQQNYTNIGDGRFVTDFRLDVPMGDMTIGVGGGLAYYLSSTLNNTTDALLNMRYGGSFKFALAKPLVANVAFGLLGTSRNTMDTIAISGQLTPDPLVDILFGTKLLFATGKTMFNGADVCARLNIGVADIYLGYLLNTSNGTTDSNVVWAPVVLKNGGLYVKFYSAF